ncbi:MAG: penicillin-insensitive murein endopeptidase [Myxococcota bacterium]
MRRVRSTALVVFLSSLAILVLGTAALARPPGADRNANAERHRYRGPGARIIPRRSRSVGFPWDGSLRRSVRVEPTRFVRHVNEYREADRFYGTWELVQLVERAAYRVWQRAPGAPLNVGELSARGGGEIPGHASHENGRDVDFGFYMLDAQNRSVPLYAFAEVNGDGQGTGPNRGLRFDDQRNFELVSKLVTDGDARVQYIFVANSVRHRLLRYGRRHRTRTVILDRLSRVMMQPSGRHPHRNHFHVRMFCPPADRPSCKDRAPFHAWYPGELPRPLASL